MTILSINKIMHSFYFKIPTIYAAVKNYRYSSYDHKIQTNQNSIIISESRDIYENLAFEDWLYKNVDFQKNDVFMLLLWYNGPSVVIGRHQNPWLECSLDFCRAERISIARRNSGGGTVYHDYGNVNFSFFTSRKNYNRKNNLRLIINSILSKWPINLSISSRDDILYNEKYKISGTASKIGKSTSYHHCTVLVDVDEIKLHQALHRDMSCAVKSRATASTGAKIINLKEVCSDVNVGDVIQAVAQHFKFIYEVKDISSVYPREELFAGLSEMKETLMSWKWCFGHTPPFTVTKSFPICPSSSVWKKSREVLPPLIDISLVCNRGSIEGVDIAPPILETETLNGLVQCVRGFKFSDSITDPLEAWAASSNNKILCKYIKCCLLQMIFDVYK